MADKKTGFCKRLFSRLGSMILALVAAVLIYLAVVLLQTPGAKRQDAYIVEETQPPVTRMQAATMNDARELARMFEARLPVLSGYRLSGQGVNTSHDGENARLVNLYYNGVTISAVRPSAAAPLLLHGELNVDLRSDLTVLNLPAVMAAKGNARCLYFSDETTAYSIYAPNAEEDAFLALLPRLSWVSP